MLMQKLIIISLFIVTIFAVFALYFNKNIERNFEIVGTLELWTIKGLGQTSCGFTGLINYEDKWYHVQAPSNKCDLYKSLENKYVKVIGTLKVHNMGKQPEYSQTMENVDIYTIYPTEIIELNNYFSL
jgi:ribonucleotide reductase beta subunit family protein with ferritin-like domain